MMATEDSMTTPTIAPAAGLSAERCEALLEIAAKIHNLRLEHANREAVIAHIGNASRMAAQLDALPLDDSEMENAAVFEPGSQP